MHFAALKYFCKRLISSSAGDFSVHKVYLELKSQGYKRACNFFLKWVVEYNKWFFGREA
jgi:hypothetical protein